MYTIEFTNGQDSENCETWDDVKEFLDSPNGITGVQFGDRSADRRPFWSADDSWEDRKILGYVIDLDHDK